MSVLNRKLRRDLLGAKGVLSAIIGIIAVGVACFVGMASLYFDLDQSRRSYYARCRMADFWVELKKLPRSELDRLNDVPGILEIRPRIAFPVTVDLEDVEKPLSGRVISLPAHPAPVLNNIVLKRGSYFSDRRRDEVIVNDAFARARHVRPGDRIHLILNNHRQELLVVGTAISSEFVYLLGPGGLVPDPENFGVFYVKQRFAEEVFDFQGACNELLGRIDLRRRGREQEILDRIETRLEPFGVASTIPLSRQASHWFLSSEIRGLRVTVMILPTIFLTVAALILNVLMRRLAEQQRTVIGTLKAFGYGDRELAVHYLKFGTSVGLIGGMLGVLGGYLLAGQMTEIYKQFYEFPNLVNQMYPGVILAAVLIGVLFASVGTLRGVRAVLRLAPAEAMRPRPPRRGGRILLERLHGIWSRLDFRWQIVLRSLFRNRMRSAVGIFSAAIGAGLILMTLHLRDAMLELIEYQYDKILLSDFDLSLKDEHNYGALLETRSLPGVDVAEPVLNVACTFHHGHRRKRGAVTGILPTARLTVPRDTSGSAVRVPPVGLIVTGKLADILELRPGETLRVVPVSGRRKPVDVQVVRIIDSYLGLAAYADFNYLNSLIGEEESVNQLQLLVDSQPRQVRRFYRAVKRLPAVQSVNAIREQKAMMIGTLVDKMLVSIFVVIGFAGLMFFGSILNASLVSLAERRREIAMLRVLGYRAGEVGSIFLRESFCLNGLGTLLGLVLGYWFSGAMDRAYDTELFRIPFVIRPASWMITGVLGILFTLLAHGPVQRAINRMDWLDALNARE